MTLATLENMSRFLQVEPYEIFQFSSIQTNQEMYDKIIDKLNLIKNDNEKLRTAYIILENIL